MVTIVHNKFNPREKKIFDVLLNQSGLISNKIYQLEIIPKSLTENYEHKTLDNLKEKVTNGVLLSLGSDATRLLLKLKKTFKFKEYVGKQYKRDYLNNIPIVVCWSMNYILNNAKTYETETVKLFKGVNNLLKGDSIEKQASIYTF